ncbi:MAG TPA: bifunctional 4-hydroxy-2-oxoglutarate aldolase/2-dehydro-3-deoxy-phosphogluconate aldolase [Chthoniobacterales bacterium]
MKADFASLLHAAPVIAILRRPKVDPYACIDLLFGRGIRLIEMTMESEGVLEAIQNVKRPPGTMFGAGTVTNPVLAEEALAAGADFLVTPNFNPGVVAVARERGVPICCGAMTPTEIFDATEAGADFIKVFPAATLGPQYFREVLGPLSAARLIATGGITPDNAADYFAAGVLAVGVGGALIPKRPEDLNACGEAAERLLLTAGKARR